MIKLEICRCIKPYNEHFKEGELYVVHPSKSSGDLTAYTEKLEAFSITPKSFISTKIPYYKIYFEPLGEMYLKNYKEVKKIKLNTAEEILSMLQKVDNPF